MMTEYKIHIEDDIVTVCVSGNEYVKAFYFGADNDPEGTALELQCLLMTAGIDAKVVEE